MVKVKTSPHLAADGTISVESWLHHATVQRSSRDMALIRHACVLSKLAGEEHPTLTGISCLQQGLTMAEILLDLHLDAETIAAALVYSCANYADLSLDDIREHLGAAVAELVRGAIQMDAIRSLSGLDNDNHVQIENIRKMLLAMVEDMRVVIIKLAERTTIMRYLDVFDAATCQQIARETLDIYAPLANRLGIGQLKWELEDHSLHYLEPNHYQTIASSLNESRLAREHYIEKVIAQLQTALRDSGLVNFQVQGRVKHIYSIYRKMLRKKLKYHQLFDLNATRILTNSIEDCYTALSIVHNLWTPIPSEYDDYIATPKPNGYRSIHTAVTGPEEKTIEVQIRTYQMHKESEHGVAAHWRYKEGGQQKASYEAKIAWLQQVLAWQKELTKAGQTLPNQQHPTALDDRVYVFTPAGEIVDLPQGSTPLDFAYHIHSEVGHRCRGAKINGTIVPLTYLLNTGEQVEILTAKQPNPSRDWLNSHLGYLKSARAKAKVHHWFKLQDYDKNVIEGQNLLERECQRLALPPLDQDKLAHKLHFKTSKDMFAALGSGDLRMPQVIGAIQHQLEINKKQESAETIPLRPAASKSHAQVNGISIAGVGNLLTHTARCCKPVPGDAIIGFITKGKGVAIHRKDCLNILNLHIHNEHRLFEVDWGQTASETYPVDILIKAYDRSGLIRDVTTLVANEKLNLLAVNTYSNRAENLASITLTIEINCLNTLSKLLDRIKHIPNVFEVTRLHSGH